MDFTEKIAKIVAIIKNQLNKKADIAHTHNEYSPSTHDHNSSYYGKKEVDRLIQDAQLGGSGGTVNTSWESITGKPDTFPSEPHHHDERYLNKFIVDTVTTDFNTAIEEGRYLVNGTDIAHAPETGQLKGMLIVSRNNDGTQRVQRYYGGSARCTAYRYYIDNVWGDWHEYSFSTHYHDIRYYKKTEIDEKLAGLGSGSANVTWETLTGKPSTFPPATHNHDSSYAKTNHNHGTTYASLTHTHDNYATKTDLNNVNATQINGKKVWTGTQAEYDRLGTQIDANTLYFIMEG